MQCALTTSFIFFVFGSLSLTDSFQNSLKTRINLQKIAYTMSKNCLRGDGGRKGGYVRTGGIAPWLLGDRRPGRSLPMTQTEVFLNLIATNDVVVEVLVVIRFSKY